MPGFAENKQTKKHRGSDLQPKQAEAIHSNNMDTKVAQWAVNTEWLLDSYDYQSCFNSIIPPAIQGFSTAHYGLIKIWPASGF